MYDAENRMISASLGINIGSSSYGYNADGKRVVRHNAWYIYGISGEMIAEYPAEGAANVPSKEYASGGQTMIAAEVANVRWTVTDSLGAPRIEVKQLWLSLHSSTLQAGTRLPTG